MSRCIVTVGVSDQRGFGPYHDRFDKTLGVGLGAHAGPGGVLSCADEVIRWEHEWPPGSPAHHEVHYAFKVHAVREARRRGHDVVLWLDVACHAVAPLEPMWAEIEREGHYLAGDVPVNPDTDSFDRLGEWSSDKSLAEFGVSRDEAMRIVLLSGTCFGLDFRHERSRRFFDRLASYAVPGHYNGTHSSGLLGKPAATEGAMVSDDPRVKGHRSDEAYMALVARDLGMKSSGEMFTGGNAVRRSTLIRSGYDLPPEHPPTGYEPPVRWTRAHRLACIGGEHTIAPDLLRGGLVLDAGCRDFLFAKEMVARGCRVVALDADPTIADPGIEGVAYLNLALDAEPGERDFLMYPDPQARRFAPEGIAVQGVESVRVSAVTLDQLREALGLPEGHVWDVVKLDVEGAEYGLLARWPGPVARQVSVEFHEHIERRPREVYDAILAHLGQWYEVVRHDYDYRHQAGGNFWDSALVLKPEFLNT